MSTEILKFFKVKDPILYEHMRKFPDELVLDPVKPDIYFYRLCRSIAYQQLNGKAASTIWGRFEDILPGKKVTPENVIKASPEEMRACGLSNAKVSYIKNIAEAFKNDANYLQLDHLSNEEIIELLTKIKGVGRWTAEMFLMFTLGREDIYSIGDFGLKKGMMKVYNLRKEPTKKKMEQITKKWMPYRTYGSLILWKVLDTKGQSTI
jgi:DNA-3-methyladenine glycosylase II